MKLVLAVILLAGLASGIPAAAPAGCCPSPGGDDYAPVWSPSGTLVAFTRIGQIDSGTFIVRPDGSGLKQLSRQRLFRLRQLPPPRSPTLGRSDSCRKAGRDRQPSGRRQQKERRGTRVVARRYPARLFFRARWAT